MQVSSFDILTILIPALLQENSDEMLNLTAGIFHLKK